MSMGRAIILSMLRWRRRIVSTQPSYPPTPPEPHPESKLGKANLGRTGKRVIESGWGQRFPLAGTSLFRNLTFGRLPTIPLEYILVYAPRTEEEIRTVMTIVKASVQYVTGEKDVR
jgi:hypothetical protein